MIETEHTFEINKSIESVWDYVRSIQGWANAFPGCRECIIIDDDNSQWIIKVGVGGLVRTVKVSVHVDKWDGPERVDFSYKLDSEPVVGSGSYTAKPQGPDKTEMKLRVVVNGSGHMAPMWEAMCRPLLPELAKKFGTSLKSDIEATDGIEIPISKENIFSKLSQWGRELWLNFYRRINP